MNLARYKEMVKVGSLEFRDKLKVFLIKEGYRINTTYLFTQKELEELTGIKVVWWNNWANHTIPSHILLFLHLDFEIDLEVFFATGELKKISREGAENVCA